MSRHPLPEPADCTWMEAEQTAEVLEAFAAMVLDRIGTRAPKGLLNMSPNALTPRPKVDHADDVTHLLRAGESPEVIAARLGLKPSSVARSLRRYGMPGVARPFDRVAKADRPSRARSAAA